MPNFTISGLYYLAGATDPATLADQNSTIIEDELFRRQATKVNGVRNTTNGPPTVGTHVINELWVDQNGSRWQCTAAGTPGTWIQIDPARLAAYPTGTVPNNYQCIRTDLTFAHYRYDLATATWVLLYAPSSNSGVRISSAGNLQIKNTTTSLWHDLTAETFDSQAALKLNPTGVA